MCCGKGGPRAVRERWVVTMPNGVQIPKSSEIQAKNYAARHPGSTYAKVEAK